MKNLWILFGFIFVMSFATLLWIGTEIFREAPPIPTQVVTTDGKVLIAEGEISNGQNVWQALGGMQVGSIWGHGSYVAPDWTADYLHREAVYVLDSLSNKELGKDYASLESKDKAAVRQQMQDMLRTNTFDAASRKLTIDPVRA
ncbi:MAG: nitric-oxide reductase large subunit, partial [Pyrinomonadaceae bacterium]|nr:nitric-oxide reductase large subunit [Pyrinomonadaceae bacterium]